jgi:predicted phage-related endonuclease
VKILNFEQNSPEWHAHRETARNASEAPVIMPGPSNTTRNEFLRLKAGGVRKEISAFLQKIFDRGHEVEPALRAYAEEIIDDDLYPICGVSDDGFFSSSFDGVTADHRIIFEGKQPNKEKRAHIEENGTVPPVDYWQVVHQFATNENAEACIYAVGDGTKEGTVHAAVRRAEIAADIPRLRAGWLQFEEDERNYQHVETPVAPVVEVQTLPAVSVQVNGNIEIASNLPAFGDALKSFIERIDMKPETDQAFAEAEAAIKTLTKAHEALNAAKDSGLAQISTVDEMVRTVDSLDELTLKTRRSLENMVKRRKEEIRAETAQKARAAWLEHVATLNKRLNRVCITALAPDFAAAMKSKRTIDSLRAAVDDALAAAKVEANQQAEAFAANLAIIDEIAKDHQFLVSRDLSALVALNIDHLRMTLKERIAAHEAEQQRKLDEERERIRREEEARAQREAEQKAEAEREKIRAEERQRLADEAAAQAKNTPEATPVPPPAAASAAAVADATPRKAGAAPMPAANSDDGLLYDRAVELVLKTRKTSISWVQRQLRIAYSQAAQMIERMEADGIVSPAGHDGIRALLGEALREAEPVDTGARVKLGEICAAIAPLKIDAAGLAQLGFQPVGTEGAAKLYAASDVPRMLNSMISRLQLVVAMKAAA